MERVIIKKHDGKYRIFCEDGKRYYKKFAYKQLANAIKTAEKYHDAGWWEYVGTDEVQKPTKRVVPTCEQYGIKVGDIWRCSWGYEQTNIDFYEVTRITRCSVELTAIKHTTEQDTWGSGKAMPCPGHYCGKPKLHRLNDACGEPCVTMTSYADAYPWDGKPEYCSWWY